MIELLMTLILHEMKNWDEVDINAYSRAESEEWEFVI